MAEFTDSQKKITDILNGMLKVLLEKNKRYGDSALHPNNIFYKGNSTDSICIRLDDKLGRVKNSSELRTNDVADIIGYCVLLLASKNVTSEDLISLID